MTNVAGSATDLQEAYRRLELSHRLALAIGAAGSVDEALEATLRIVCEASGWVLGQVWAPDSSGEVLQCSPVWFQAEPGYESFREASLSLRFSPGEPLLGQVWADREPRWAEHLSANPRLFRRAPFASAVGLSTALVVPVVVGGEVICVLEFFTREERPADAGLRDMVVGAGAQLGSLIRLKQAEEALRQNQEHFRAVCDWAHDAIVSIDETGTITYANAQTGQMLGHPVGDLVGEPVTVLIPERFHAAHWAGCTRYLETGEPRLIGRTVMLPARCRDGDELPVELSLSTWEVAGRRYFTAIMRDISERQRAQEELERALSMERQAAARLQEVDQLKNTFLDAVSHDLRSPLAVIRAVLTRLRGDGSAPGLSVEERHAYLGQAAGSADKMRRLLDDLLDLERIESGQLSLSTTKTNIAHLVRRLIEEHSETLAGRDISTNLRPVVAEVDPAKVERILENLLMNAVRHTPAGTPIWVSVQRSGGAVLIRVEDAGPGVPDHARETIFNRFGQVPSISGVGTGLGLSLVARLAELHGGRAWVEDRPGGGASFRVLLPGRAVGRATSTLNCEGGDG